MNLNVSIKNRTLKKLKKWFDKISTPYFVVVFSIALGIIAIIYSFAKDYIIAYGDAESHLNIAKRVINDLTPGFAQLGGIWLPIPHLMMLPFIWVDFLWRTGLAGSIVSMFCYVVSAVFIYKTTELITRSKIAAFVASVVFMLNPNILYMQSTPMTELPLIMFFILSTYFFIRFIKNDNYLFSLIAAGFFGFCATLTRYDGWFLVIFQALTILIMYYRKRDLWKKMEGKFLLYATPAFFGILLWLLWDYLILGSAFYFTTSEFSAKTQQANWLAKGELPAFHNLLQSVAYYVVTAMSNTGIIVFSVALVGFIQYLLARQDKKRVLIGFIMLVPFVFYIFTLFVGQSVIFIPHLTPVGFEWRLFNVRYGLMAVPFAAIFFGYLFYKSKKPGKSILIGLLLFQFLLFGIGYSKVITLADGTVGLSHAKRPNAEYWMKAHYDGGLVLLDDYARTMSIVRSGVPMQNTIYVGNKPYWEQSLAQPQLYARWVIMQKDDAVWKHLYDNQIVRGRLYKYFKKAYTSPEILIFEKID